MDAATISINIIGLSTRSANALRRAGVHTVSDMLSYTEESLRELPNLGRKSIDEILSKIQEWQSPAQAERNLVPASPAHEPAIDFNTWVEQPDGKEYITAWLQKQQYPIDVLDTLSTRAYNLLLLNGCAYLYQIAFLTEADLMQLSRMDAASADEIVPLCRQYISDHRTAILADFSAEQQSSSGDAAIFNRLYMPEYHDMILRYVKANDRPLGQLALSARALSRLQAQGYQQLSDIIFLTKNDLHTLPGAGTGTVQNILSAIHDYITANAEKLTAVCTGDETVLLSDAAIRSEILNLYQNIGFDGLSFSEIEHRIRLPEAIPPQRLKKVIGGLLAEHELEYVDFRCYLVYPGFTDALHQCDRISERTKSILQRRLQGATLEAIAHDPQLTHEHPLTRERVRQIVKNSIPKVQNWYADTTGKQYFDEDYYRYFYEHYAFEKDDAAAWFGMTIETYYYLSLSGLKHGTGDLQDALDDKNLDISLRLKIKNYLHRDNLFIDGVWVPKRRAELEEVVVRKYCTDTVTFDEFTRLYNEFLRQNDVRYDENLYFTEAVASTRRNRLADTRFLLWTQNEHIRYYDIDDRDYADLLNALNLESYENIEISTLKFVEDYPQILQKYDIRDQYELHNLLRKIVPEGSYHDFHCCRMPIIRFGTFDRTAALLNILIANTPIDEPALCERIHDAYGYDRGTIAANYLRPLYTYYHQGTFKIEHKVMSNTHRSALQQALTEDFYYIDDVRRIYLRLFPQADPAEINPFNLKNMGFSVFSRYVLQNYPSLNAYFEDILTREEILDISPYKKRFVYVQMFGQKLTELKHSLQIIEFEPNQIVNFRRLERSGISRDMIHDFCNAVYDFVEDGSYFSAQSLRQDGFQSELYELGFSDWFYANLLLSDDRFSFGTMFGNIILFKGQENITIRSFEISRIRAHGSIDNYDLMTELTDYFGCTNISDRLELRYKVQGSDVYFDPILERFYADVKLYERELDAAEDMAQ